MTGNNVGLYRVFEDTIATTGYKWQGGYIGGNNDILSPHLGFCSSDTASIAAVHTNYVAMLKDKTTIAIYNLGQSVQVGLGIELALVGKLHRCSHLEWQ